MMRYINVFVLIATLSMLGLFSESVSALTYQSGVQNSFTFNSTLSLTVSDNLTINNLTPGTSSDSNQAIP